MLSGTAAVGATAAVSVEVVDAVIDQAADDDIERHPLPHWPLAVSTTLVLLAACHRLLQ